MSLKQSKWRRRRPNGNEQREKLLRNKMKKMFQHFIDKVSSIKKESDQEFEFEEPSPDLGFYGVPLKETVLCMPTTNCLVSLTQNIPYVSGKCLVLAATSRSSPTVPNVAHRGSHICVLRVCLRCSRSLPLMMLNVSALSA